MAGESEDKTHDATPKKLAEARERGDLPISREGSAAGGLACILLAMLLVGGMTMHRIGDVLVPLVEQPEAFLDLNSEGLLHAARHVAGEVAIALSPLFGLLLAGAFLPHIFQNSLVFSISRLRVDPKHLSPLTGLKKLFDLQGLFEFAKSIVKMLAVGVTCYFVARPLYDQAANLVGLDIRALLPIMYRSIIALVGATTMLACVIAGIDVPYQRWSYARRQRMSLEDIKEEMRQSEGDPQIKGKLKQMRRDRARRRMMHDVKTASVVITNPTHYAVALRYERGKDTAPVVVAKGLDLVALKIREVARESNVAVMEDRPLARALYANTEIGDAIPREHFEAVAKIIGLIWAQKKPAMAKQVVP